MDTNDLQGLRNRRSSLSYQLLEMKSSLVVNYVRAHCWPRPQDLGIRTSVRAPTHPVQMAIIRTLLVPGRDVTWWSG